jgi:hypothetical protein
VLDDDHANAVAGDASGGKAGADFDRVRTAHRRIIELINHDQPGALRIRGDDHWRVGGAGGRGRGGLGALWGAELLFFIYLKIVLFTWSSYTPANS